MKDMNILEVAGGKPIKLWTQGVPVEEEARQQLLNTAKMPFIFKHLAVMPDVHLGKGSTIGSVIPTLGAIIPAAVGVDIGCGMIAARTSLLAADLPDKDLAYFEESSRHFDDYVEAVGWAQDFARQNRALMMHAVIEAARQVIRKPFEANLEAVDCHHNYVQKERHFGQEVLVTRKGAVSAQKGQLGIIPGSMGAKSFIVRGLGNQEAFCSCSHGAGRTMSRTKAKKVFSVADQARATAHVECRKDADVIDEIPMAYKDIDRVMEAQRELVEVLHTLRQVVCVKG